MYKIPATTLFLGKNLIFVPECHSTNDRMLLLCQKESPPEGTVIITANQTAGRGQRGNSWEAAPGMNLTFTALVKPHFLAVQKQFYLNIFVSLGICDYLTAQTGKKVQIKWPNDVLIDHRKICGILIENQLKGNHLWNSVVGVGLNVNQQQFGSANATSVALELNHKLDLSNALTELLHSLEFRYLQLRNKKEDLLLRDYLDRLYLYNQHAEYCDSSATFVGRIIGIDDIGRLKVERQDGIFTYDIKEIRYPIYS